MQKIAFSLVALLCLALASAAHSQAMPRTVNFRFSEQVSNAPAGTCGCFGLEGAAGDLAWNLKQLGGKHGAALGLAADVGVEHTGSVNGANYGLTLTTLAAGPRFMLPGHKLQPFAQALFGFAHGSGSSFPQNNALVSSANSFALDLGAAADYSLDKRFSVRLLQLDYLRTSLPNITTNWQNNLRIGAGVTLHFAP
jgi:hypothetical protein